MFTLHSLAANEVLTKTISKDLSGNIVKSNYPAVFNFTSHDHVVKDLASFHFAIASAAKQGHCLLKGKLKHPLVNESRAGSTNTDDTTHWLVLDLDGLQGFKSVADFMDQHPDLHDISYIVQYSSSFGLPTTIGIHAHVFFMLSHEYHATYAKGWLTKQNIDGELFAGAIVKQLRLNRTASVLHYPIDITACQNDKLIYVANPIVAKSVTYKLPPDGFIQLVKKKNNYLPIERLEHGSVEKQKTEAKKRFNTLRKEAGLDPINVKALKITKEGFELQPECGQFHITGQKEERGFRYFNMNGGDSWSWYHPVDNFKYIHCFKDACTYLTERILPKYYARCLQDRKQAAMEPQPDGTIPLAYRDVRSGAYWNGTWNPETQTLIQYQAKSEVQLDHFLKQHGQAEGIIDFIPQWTVEFNPQNATICDPDNRYLNLYVPSTYAQQQRSPAQDLSNCPQIERVILSAVSNNVYSEVTEHFMNWLAVIFQRRVKTKTAWILSGTEGTGKGLIANAILLPLIGRQNIQLRRMSELEEHFNGWLETALIAVIDEAQFSASARKGLMSADMRSYITEPTITVRNMHRQAYMASSFVNFLIYTNMNDPVILTDADRRFNCGDRQEKKLTFVSRDAIELEKELPYFMDYIMQREANIDQAASIFRNESRINIISASINSIDAVANALIQGDLNTFVESMPDIKMLIEIAGTNSAIGVQFARIVKRELEGLTEVMNTTEPDKLGLFHFHSKLSRDELFILFEHSVGNIPQSPHKFTKMLKHKHLTTTKVRIDGKTEMGIHVNWVANREWVEANKPDEPPAPAKPLALAHPIKQAPSKRTTTK